MALRYFTEDEFVMGNKNVYLKMNDIFLLEIDELRHQLKLPIKINSSYRTKEYNAQIGGSKNSMHLQGRAVDVHCIDGIYRQKIVKEALMLGFTVGVAKTFIHLDNRETQILFTY